MRPVVIGAGPAGLAAAWALARAGQRPLVLEASDRLGGLAGSFDLDGFRADYGPHRLHRVASPEVKELYALALGDSLRERDRSGLVHVGERRLPFPLSLGGLVRGLGFTGALRHGLSALAARFRPPAGDDYAGEAARRLGRHAAALVYEPAARKVWGVEPEALDAALAAARVQKSGPVAVLRAALERKDRGARRFFYPEQGCGALAEGLAARIEAAGGELRRNARVDGLVIEGGVVRAVVVDGAPIETDRVIATAPLTSLCSWAGVPETSDGLTYRALTLLYLVLEQDRASAHDVHYFTDARIPANRLFEMKGFTGGEGPAGRTLIGFDIPCTEGDSVWTASPDELVEKMRPALDRAGLDRAPIASAAVHRVAKAYPIYRKGYAAHRDRALDALSSVDGLYPVGRHALFVHDNVHHACEAGLAAGRSAAVRKSAREWRSEQAPFLHARIED
ncbi:protoporphyrinogen/coproporphyrinogen oxidase [Vulgatibacter incomptus]|uniref:Amine oxidase domain-containing protein n=1 Tax=Vulgatibacter incomptus TaxID=1391653 RepID=A0A0K1PC48_9BACT|nr:FAD-dependent oxidoreductase [Vulgatibacter incomptus]AKU91082.1 hypothetical protein AKJ08_1469 [Vulgatibacter incomptus]